MKVPMIVLTFMLYFAFLVTLWATGSYLNAQDLGYTLAGGIQSLFFLILGTVVLYCLIDNWHRWP